jgi:hypothetical protein
MVVNSASLTINANITNLTSSPSVTVTQNGTPISGFNFNPATGLTGKAKLNQGLNTFVVTATNECGTVTETFTITYIPCVVPVITFINPAVNGMTVSNQNFAFSASVVNPGSVMDMKINGRTITTFNFNNSTSLLTANLALIQGTNTIMVTATNDCGTSTETITVNYVQPDSGSGDGQGSGRTDTNSSENGGGIGKTTVIICHNEKGVLTTMEIPITELPAHEAHGDKIGACPDNKGKLEDKPSLKPTESTPKTPESGRGGL